MFLKQQNFKILKPAQANRYFFCKNAACLVLHTQKQTHLLSDLPYKRVNVSALVFKCMQNSKTKRYSQYFYPFFIRRYYFKDAYIFAIRNLMQKKIPEACAFFYVDFDEHRKTFLVPDRHKQHFTSVQKSN